MDKDNTLFKSVEVKKVVIDGREFELPIRYYDDTAMIGIFTAPTKLLRKVLPSSRFKPVEIWPSVSLVSLVGLCHHDTSIGPFDELDIGIPILFDTEFAIPFLSAFTYSKNVNFGTYMYRLFVSDEKALTAGIKVWNYPKVIAKIVFEDTPTHKIMRISKDGRSIIDFKVRMCSQKKYKHATVFNIFSIKENRILKSPVDWKGDRYSSMSRSFASFELGDSEYVEELKCIGLKNHCVEGSFYPDLQYILNPPIATYHISKEK